MIIREKTVLLNRFHSQLLTGLGNNDTMTNNDTMQTILRAHCHCHVVKHTAQQIIKHTADVRSLIIKLFFLASNLREIQIVATVQMLVS